MFSEPFVDYGYSRNRVLDVANTSTLRPVFTLVLSADERVINPKDLRSFLEDVRFAYGESHGAYPVIMNSGADFDSVRIARVDSNWRYFGRVHEYLSSPKNEWRDLYRPVPEIRVKFSATDTDRRFKSQYFIISILEDEISKNPLDTRSYFYLARTFHTVGNFTASIWAYKKLAEVTRWDEEKYEGRYGEALVLLDSKHPWPEVERKLLDLYSDFPHRMDAIYYIGDYYFNTQKFHLAYLFALRCVEMPRPENWWKIENVQLREVTALHKYKAQRLLGFAANKIGEFKKCIEMLQYVMSIHPDDKICQQWLDACIIKGKSSIAPSQITILSSAEPKTFETESNSFSYVFLYFVIVLFICFIIIGAIIFNRNLYITANYQIRNLLRIVRKKSDDNH